MNKLNSVVLALALLLPASLLGGEPVPPPHPDALIPAPEQMYRNTPPVLEKHGTGYIPEDPDEYLVMPQVEPDPFQNYLTPQVDLSASFPKPGNQGKQGSCVAWATVYARSYYQTHQQGGNPNDPDHLFSPAFIYNQIKTGSCDSGSSISDALILMKKSGVAPLAEFPYEERNCSRLPDIQVRSDAERYRIDDWKKLDVNNLDSIKEQLFAGNPVIFGMYVSDSFDKLHGNNVYDDVSSPRSEGHVMVLVGYDESRQAFKLLNSWGVEWGDKGLGWISYGALKKWVQNAFVMRIGPAPVRLINTPTLEDVLSP